MEVVAGALETVEVPPVEAAGDDVGVRLDEHHERRPHALHRPVVEPAQLGEVEAAAVALVGERRVDAAVADDGATGAQRRKHDLGEVLGTVGGGDQRLGAGVELGDVVVVEDLAQPLPDRRAARLVGEHGAERLGEQRRLGALAAALGPLEGDVGRRQPSLPLGPLAVAAALLGGASSSPGAFLAAPSCAVFGGPPLAATCSRRTASSSKARSARHLLDAVAAPDRGVRLAVGDVHAEASVPGDDRPPAHRIGAELAQRALRRHAAAAALGTPSAGRAASSASSRVTVSSRSSLSSERYSLPFCTYGP